MPSGVKKRKAARKKKEQEAKINSSSNNLPSISIIVCCCCCLGFFCFFNMIIRNLSTVTSTFLRSSICRLHFGIFVCFSSIYVVWINGSFVIRPSCIPLVDPWRSSCSSSVKTIRSLLVGYAVNGVFLFGFTFNACGFG